jgi:hypothetical protein
LPVILRTPSGSQKYWSVRLRRTATCAASNTGHGYWSSAWYIECTAVVLLATMAHDASSLEVEHRVVLVEQLNCVADSLSGCTQLGRAVEHAYNASRSLVGCSHCGVCADCLLPFPSIL